MKAQEVVETEPVLHRGRTAAPALVERAATAEAQAQREAEPHHPISVAVPAQGTAAQGLERRAAQAAPEPAAAILPVKLVQAPAGALAAAAELMALAEAGAAVVPVLAAVEPAVVVVRAALVAK